MSRLHLRERSGKVVLERPEGGASCLREQLTSYAEGVQHLVSAPHEIRLELFFRPLKPIHIGRPAVLRHSAFQAGCRGFEFRLPTFDIHYPLMRTYFHAHKIPMYYRHLPGMLPSPTSI
jgi:hypothetical protein